MLFLLTALYNWHSVVTRCTTAEVAPPNNKQQNAENVRMVFMIGQPPVLPESVQQVHRYLE